MCQAIEELNRKVAERAAKQVAQEATKREHVRVALELLALGILSDEKIAEISQLTLEEVRELNAQRTA